METSGPAWDDVGVAQVILRAPLSELCGGRMHSLEGGTVLEVLRSLERAHAAVAGWVLDERGRIRPHVNVFVNGDHGREHTPVAPGDRVHVLPAITGG
jgi:molybdopterin synthase sulfur carrier subunit